MEGLLAMLLVKCGEGGGVGRSYLVVRRGRREGVVGFGREVTSVHDIGFLGVAGVVACEVGEVGGVAGGEGGVANAIVA